MGNGDWRDEDAGEQGAEGRIFFLAQCPMPNAQCPMPNAQSPMPNPQSPIPNPLTRYDQLRSNNFLRQCQESFNVH
ncbi:hypothetical protein A4S05_22900 [Nostoc sp. KVJ20]|uniref:hypothetical protein n=1 Tax=Nostoc sp. KVJ20 TaxID=457944 RepID=UPI00083DA0E3|nr:hypothetical protein [Nostoc sp. KVJ20]ODH02670.1 hypothetical protein A4S05_22900 [Nostoc sp. KVJ20]